MFHFAGTVLNNIRLEQLYYILYIIHYTLLVETTTICFILSNRQVVIRKQKYIVICGKNNTPEMDNT